MKEKSLLKRLTEYKATPFHMPGHKRAMKKSIIPYSIDITEVDGFDNLHNMQGVLKDVADRARGIYKAVSSYPLVNGSTCGILAAIYSATRENKKILIARNCHKSVYNAAEILDLEAHYLLPEADEFGIYGKISAQTVAELLDGNAIGCVVITSPTYEGVMSDVASIYEVCKERGAFLIVDSAHGGHFFDHAAPHCDMCVVSLHKTLPSLTQTALLNVCSGRVDTDLVRHALSIFETSSPSYVLLASIDECLRYIKKNKDKLMSFYKNLDCFYERCKSLKNIEVSYYDDKSKIIIKGQGEKIAEKLRGEKIEPEMVAPDFVLALATLMDTKKTLKKLQKALLKIDKTMDERTPSCIAPDNIPQKKLSAKEALSLAGEYIDISDSEGRVSLEYVWAYPPGVPILVPGEEISDEIIDYIKSRNDLYSTRGQLPKIYTKEL